MSEKWEMLHPVNLFQTITVYQWTLEKPWVSVAILLALNKEKCIERKNKSRVVSCGNQLLIISILPPQHSPVLLVVPRLDRRHLHKHEGQPPQKAPKGPAGGSHAVFSSHSHFPPARPHSRKFDLSLVNRNLVYVGDIMPAPNSSPPTQSFKLDLPYLDPLPSPLLASNHPPASSPEALQQPPVYSVLISLYPHCLEANPDTQLSIWKDKMNENGPFSFPLCCQSNIS